MGLDSTPWPDKYHDENGALNATRADLLATVDATVAAFAATTPTLAHILSTLDTSTGNGDYIRFLEASFVCADQRELEVLR